jgi:hypothetical protein
MQSAVVVYNRGSFICCRQYNSSWAGWRRVRMLPGQPPRAVAMPRERLPQQQPQRRLLTPTTALIGMATSALVTCRLQLTASDLDSGW